MEKVINWRIKSERKGIHTIQYPVKLRTMLKGGRDDSDGSWHDFIFTCTAMQCMHQSHECD